MFGKNGISKPFRETFAVFPRQSRKLKSCSNRPPPAGAAQNLTPIFAASSLVRCDALDDPADYRPDRACDDEFDTRRQLSDLNENALRVYRRPLQKI
jgi:hypothetical protein